MQEAEESVEEKPEVFLEEEEWPSLSLGSEVIDVQEAEESVEEKPEDPKFKENIANDFNQSIKNSRSSLLGELRFSDD